MTTLAYNKPAERAGFSIKDLQSILVIKLDRLGDFILLTPFLRGLRASAPNARIDLVVTRRTFALAEGCPYVDRVISSTIKEETCTLSSTNSFAVQTFLNDLRNHNFDLAVVPRWDYDFWAASSFARASGAPHRVGFSIPLCYGGLLDYTAYYTGICDRPEVAHELDRNLALLDFLGGTAQGDHTEIWISPQEQQSARIKLAQALGDAPFLSVYTGASQKRRALPPHKLRSILAGVSARFPALHYLFLGSEDDEMAVQDVMSELPNSVSLCGKTSVRESAVITGMSIAAVSMDSAGAHMAAAMNVPVVAFSCHPVGGDPDDVHSPTRFGPRGPRPAITLQPWQPTPPCEDRCRGKYAHCILNIRDEVAIEAICEVVSGRILEAVAAQQVLDAGLKPRSASVGIAPVNGVLPVEARKPPSRLLDYELQGC